MSNLSTLPKGDSAWLLRKAIQRVMQQVSVLEANIGSSTTGNSANTQVIFNDDGTLRGDPDLIFNTALNKLVATNLEAIAALTVGTSATFNGNTTVRTNKLAVTSTGTGFGTATPGAAYIADFVGDVRMTGTQSVVGNQSVTGDLNVTGTVTASGGVVSAATSSAIRAAASDYAAVAFDGATSSQRIVSTITTNPITTGDYTVWSRFRVPTTTSSNQDPLWTLGSVADGGGAYGITARYFTNSNTLNILVRSSSGASGSGDFASADVTIPYANYAGQVVDLVVVRVGSALTVYVNGSSLSVTYAGTQASFGLAPGNYPTNPTQVFGVGASTTTPFRGRIYRSVVFNRALSAADVTELITTGVNPADQWGSQTGQTSGTLVASKRYRITTYVSADSFTNVGAASNTTGVEFVATGTTPTTWTNGSTLNRIGAIVDLDYTVGAGFQSHDRSSNNLHGTLFNAVEFSQPKRVAVLYATTNTNGNQQMLGTLAIPTNAIIEDIIVNSTGSATVSVGNVSAGTQIVNGASVVSGRQRLTIATPFSTTGNLWVNSNATATLQFTILYTIAS